MSKIYDVYTINGIVKSSEITAAGGGGGGGSYDDLTDRPMDKTSQQLTLWLNILGNKVQALQDQINELEKPKFAPVMLSINNYREVRLENLGSNVTPNSLLRCSISWVCNGGVDGTYAPYIDTGLFMVNENYLVVANGVAYWHLWVETETSITSGETILMGSIPIESAVYAPFFADNLIFKIHYGD